MNEIIAIERIEKEAKDAAKNGQTASYACSWPFSSPAGRHWLKTYDAALESARLDASLQARKASA